MAAIQLNSDRPNYTSQRIAITPDPPQVGIPATITLEISNTDTQPLTVQRIELAVALFGMGLSWESLTPVGPFTIAPNQVEQVAIEWTPRVGGHRCLRAQIYTDLSQSPLRIGRNMQVIESETATQFLWRVPFGIGNPLNRPAPILLTIEHDAQVQALLVVKDRVLLPGETIELAAKEEVQGRLVLLAETQDALNSAIAVEAFINQQFLDGIEVTVLKTVQKPRKETEDSPSGMEALLSETSNVSQVNSVCPLLA